MAFPTVPSSGTTALTSAPTGTTSPRTFPDLGSLTKNAGDLLIAICIAYQSSASAGTVFSSWGGGFTEFLDVGGTTSNMSIGAAYKFSTGSETGTFTVAQAATVTGHAAMILLSIAGAHATSPPEGGAIANGTSAAADPVSLSPSWGADDTLWIAVGGSGETSTSGTYTGISGPPANYTGGIQTGISGDVVGGVEGAVAFRQLNAASEDVGTRSVDISNARNSAVVIAVRPAATIPRNPNFLNTQSYIFIANQMASNF